MEERPAAATSPCFCPAHSGFLKKQLFGTLHTYHVSWNVFFNVRKLNGERFWQSVWFGWILKFRNSRSVSMLPVSSDGGKLSSCRHASIALTRRSSAAPLLPCNSWTCNSPWRPKPFSCWTGSFPSTLISLMCIILCLSFLKSQWWSQWATKMY